MSMVVGARPSVEDFLPHMNICDRTDVTLNKESLLSLKVVVAVVVIVIVVIFIGVLST